MHLTCPSQSSPPPAAPHPPAGPTVSAVVTMYNSADYVHRAIDSILAQEYPVCEIVVVDDGSRDGGADVVEARYGDRVRVIRQENRGPNAARNRGARASCGEWIAFHDADDTWLPHRLAVQIPWTADPEVGVISGHGVQETPCDLEQGRVTFEMMWEHNYVGVTTALIRRTAFDELGGFDEDRELVGAEDYNLWLRFARSRWGVMLVAEEIFHYTSAPGSLYSQKERCLRGELLNVDKIERLFEIPTDRARRKRASIWHTYGRDYLQMRRLADARRCFARELKLRVSRAGLVHWAATLVPAPLLELRRRLYDRYLRRDRSASNGDAGGSSLTTPAPTEP